MPQVLQTLFGNTIPSEIASESIDPKTGTAEISGIAPGRYELAQGDPPRVLDLNLTASQQVDTNGGSATDAVTGRVRMASGAPVPEEITMSLQRVDSGLGQRVDAAQAVQGRFRFSAVPPGEWAVMATTRDKALPVLTVNSGGVQRAGNALTVKERTSEFIVTLSEAPTRVEGVARKNEKGFAGAMIVLLPKNRALWKALTRRDQSDSDGSFTLPEVAPGEYTAIAIEDGWALDWTSPLAMARYLPAGTSVTVTEQSGSLLRLNSPVLVQMR
jgi:hypothetical protein